MENFFNPCPTMLYGTQTYQTRKNRQEIPLAHCMVQLYSVLAATLHVIRMAAEQWVPNILLAKACDVSSTLPQGQCHFLLAMWRSSHPDATLMGRNRGWDACRLAEEAIREI